jgi:hypothetical protein
MGGAKIRERALHPHPRKEMCIVSTWHAVRNIVSTDLFFLDLPVHGAPDNLSTICDRTTSQHRIYQLVSTDLFL